ncbi:MAG: hypothetical protein JNM24_00490 [Bdellovibrionaceae bacterium]|nr:hypothetical protein [Pseudobdellovibrionaceae bacterium]
MNRLIITETAKYSSLDPLDGDKTANLPVVRMVYLTPVQITKDNELASFVLESFAFDEKSKTITWKMKKGLKYSDGTNMTADDVAFAVARMAHKRPKFPVIETIEGLDKWLAQKSPLKSLPSGIQVQGDQIKIKLTHKHPQPLFRFCLEIFSIIPKKCVDLETSKINCASVPTSGFYKITGQAENSVEFARSHLETQNFDGPEKIKFEYWPLSSVESKLSELDENTVLAGNESHFTISALKKIESGFKVHFLPAARFTDLDINKSQEFFKDKVCRQVFAKTFRDSFKTVAGEYFNLESSIFTKIVPGYLSSNDLNKKSFAQLKDSDLAKCKEKMKSNPPAWGMVESEKESNLNKALQLTFKKLGASENPTIRLKTRDELGNLFDEEKVGIFYGGSGFWAQDAAGDLQMLFTPGLHKSLDFVTQDNSLQTLIRNLKEDPTNKARFMEINQYLHDEALFNVYSHVRRFFVSKKSSHNLELPFAITSPFPWHLFEGSK